MLEVALAPAAVAHGQVHQRGRALLIAAFQAGHHVDGPAAAAHQRGLDEVVAHDMAAEGFAAGEFGQAGLFGEGDGADQGVVAPVIALGTVPPGDAVGDHRAVDAAGKLLHPREQGGAAGDDRQGLDQPDIGMRLHGGDEAEQGVAAHDAVGVEDEELGIGGAEAGDPFGDVAGLAGGVFRAVAVEDAVGAAGAFAQRQEGLFFGDPEFGRGGVAEDEDVETVGGAEAAEVLVDRFQPGHDAIGGFVIGRHQQRGAGVGPGAGDQQAAAAAERDGNEAGEGAGEGQGDPGEQGGEHHQHEHRQLGDAVDREHAVHLVRGEAGHDDGAADHQQPAQGHGAR